MADSEPKTPDRPSPADVDHQFGDPETLIQQAVVNRISLKRGDSIDYDDDRILAFLDEIDITDVTDTVYQRTTEYRLRKHVRHDEVEESNRMYSKREYSDLPISDPDEYVTTIDFYSTDHEVSECSRCGGDEATCHSCHGDGTESCDNCLNGTARKKVTCTECGGDGQVEKGKCTDCWGDTTVTTTEDCPNCDGDGDLESGVTCQKCGGDGDWTTKNQCGSCNGTGLRFKDCPECGGDTVVEEPTPCTICNSRGVVDCTTCNGTGNWCKLCQDRGTTHWHLLITVRYRAEAEVKFEPAEDVPHPLLAGSDPNRDGFNSDEVKIPDDVGEEEIINREQKVETCPVREVTYEYEGEEHTVTQIREEVHGVHTPDLPDPNASQRDLTSVIPSLRHIGFGVAGIAAYMALLAVTLEANSIPLMGIGAAATLGVAVAIAARPQMVIPGVLVWTGAGLLLMQEPLTEMVVLSGAVAAPLALTGIMFSTGMLRMPSDEDEDGDTNDE